MVIELPDQIDRSDPQLITEFLLVWTPHRFYERPHPWALITSVGVHFPLRVRALVDS